VLELCEGKELFEELVERESFSEQTIAKILRQILQTLNYCHKRGVCHRDLKPENLIISEDLEKVKIIDFGLSCKVDPTIDASKVEGTLLYLAPEVVD
jgi:serine/threonine protein kinase